MRKVISLTEAKLQKQARRQRGGYGLSWGWVLPKKGPQIKASGTVLAVRSMLSLLLSFTASLLRVWVLSKSALRTCGYLENFARDV